MTSGEQKKSLPLSKSRIPGALIFSALVAAVVILLGLYTSTPRWLLIFALLLAALGPLGDLVNIIYLKRQQLDSKGKERS